MQIQALELLGAYFPTLGSQNEGIKTNPDGSMDIYFSPEAPAGQDYNWLQTVPGKIGVSSEKDGLN